MGMSDCVVGLLDGVNDHGLSAAIAFGGRKVVGPGFGVGLIVRYLLQVAHDVPEALEVLRQVPVQLAYNVALVDRTGRSAIAYISPDRPLVLSEVPVAGNRQGATEWPEHARFCAERYLAGWTIGEIKDRNLRTSPFLKAWAELTPDEQRKDYEQIQAIPGVLKRIGKAIYIN